MMRCFLSPSRHNPPDVRNGIFSFVVFYKWDKLRSLELSGEVVGYCHDTLGHALVTGRLKHLVTLKIRPESCFDPGYLDSDVYQWCTPLLESLIVRLGVPTAVDWRMLDQRKFFVNLPNLRRLALEFQKFQGDTILMDTPPSVTELTVVWVGHTGRLPPVLQPSVEKLSVYVGFSRELNLNLRYRQVYFACLDK
jgi:hypothetical protein